MNLCHPHRSRIWQICDGTICTISTISTISTICTICRCAGGQGPSTSLHQAPICTLTCAQKRLNACLKPILRPVQPISLLPYLAPTPSVAPMPPASSPLPPASWSASPTHPTFRSGPPYHTCTLSIFLKVFILWTPKMFRTINGIKGCECNSVK